MTRRRAVTDALNHIENPVVPYNISCTRQALDRLVMHTRDKDILSKLGSYIHYFDFWGWPEEIAGRPGYFKDILAPMPFLKLTPTGGVDLKTTADWIKAGAVCVGAGSALVGKEAVAKGDWAGITATAKQFVDIVKAARAK